MRVFLACLLTAVVAHAQVITPADPRCTNPGTRLQKGFGYLSDPQFCYSWLRCSYADENVVKTERQWCGCGMFWNDDLMTCVPAREWTCPNDPCQTAGTNNYPYEGNCRTYWVCDGTRSSLGMCCESGFRWDNPSQSCVADASCTDDCLCFMRSTEGPGVCNFTRNPADPHTYFEVVHGNRVLRDCAIGVNFNQTTCGCNDFVEIPRPACPTDFNTLCNTSPLTDLANRVWIMNVGVVVSPQQATCAFDGSSSHLCLPRYANMDWRRNWAIKLEFDGGAIADNTNAPLFSNSACMDGGATSINTVMTRNNQGQPVITGSIRTMLPAGTPTETSLSVQYRPNERNSLYVWYNGETFGMCVVYADGSRNTDSRSVTGLTVRGHCAVYIGKNDDGNHYIGNIYQVKTHVYCVPANFCGS